MRILRYPLEIVDYQQLQPLWPGHVLSVAPARPEYAAGRHDEPRPYTPQKIDLWAVENEAKQGERRAPVLGIWVVGTGNETPPEMFDHDAMFHGTCVMDNGAVWHVWSAVVGEAAEAPAPMGLVGSVADIVNRVKARHQDRR